MLLTQGERNFFSFQKRKKKKANATTVSQTKTSIHKHNSSEGSFGELCRAILRVCLHPWDSQKPRCVSHAL